MKHEPCDRLDTSRYGLMVITLVSVIALAVMTILTIHTHRDSRQTTRMWIKYLALHTLPFFHQAMHYELAVIQVRQLTGVTVRICH